LAAGHKELMAWKQEHATARVRVDLGSGDDRDLGAVVLSRAASLRVALLRADGKPWVGRLPAPKLLGGDGQEVTGDREWRGESNELRCTGLPPGAVRVSVAGDDLLCTPVDMALRAGEESRVVLRVGIGRTRRLSFASSNIISDRADLLRVVVTGADGSVVAEASVAPPKGHSWTWSHTFAFGRYEVEASSVSGQRYRGSFNMRDSLDDPTSIDVPAVVQ
jgi:hypothetical protein